MVSTSIVDSMATKAAALPIEMQREILNFVEFLSLTGIEKPKPPIRNIIGIFDHLGINITEEDIAEARREMWGNFPREEPR